MAAFLGLLTSLPKLLELAQNIWAYIEKVSGNDPQGFIIRVNDAFSALNAAKNETEIADAARKIQDAIKHTG